MWKVALFCLGTFALVWLCRAAEPVTGPSVDGPAVRAAEPKEAPAAAAEKATTSRVMHVTVYPNSALVTREVEVPEGVGPAEVVVTPLPVQTVNSSLYSEGSDGIRVLSTRFRTRPIREDTREEVRKLEDQQKELERKIMAVDADIETANLNLKMILKLEDFTAVRSKDSTEKGTLNAETVISLSKHVMDQRAEKSKDVVALTQKKQDFAEQVEYVKRQLKDLTAGRSKTERDAVIVLDKTNKAAGKVRLNYLVDSAMWRPQYKFRAGKDERENVQVEYLAAVLQQTGEDWNNVGLTLSTAQPMLNAAPPDLKMLEIAALPRDAGGNIARIPNPPGGGLGQAGGFGGGQFGFQGGQGGGLNPSQPSPQQALDLDNQAKWLRQQAQTEYNSKKETTGSIFVNEAAALEQANDLLNSEDRVTQKGKPVARATGREGPSVTYHLKTRLSVPSRNDEQVLEVTKLDMAPEYFYKAVPILSPHVYRLANLTNKSEQVLLPGEATMYQGTDFVGRMNLPLVAIGEQFTAGFGADPQLQVQRQMTEKSQNMQGGNQVLKYEYRILLSSYKTQPVAVQLWDRLPLAENEKTVVVSLNKAEPDISKDPIYLREQRPKNLLRWDLKVEPAMNGEKAMTVQYDFKLELDRQMSISTFSTTRSDPAAAASALPPMPMKK